MTAADTPMFLFHIQVQARPDSDLRGVSVWVNAGNSTQAQALATSHLTEAGWTVVCVDSEAETAAEDYFRPCPSQQAFLRAQTEGVAWRFDDE